MNKRAVIGIVSGAVLGVFCIIGVNFRMGDQVDAIFLFATWLNRLVMGMVIGFFSPVSKKIIRAVLRGAVLGLIVSLSLYAASDFLDFTGFIAGIIYGVIIDMVCTRFGSSKENS